MAHAIRIHRTIESDTLKLPELSSLVGKRVEIIVIEDEAEGLVTLTAPDAKHGKLVMPS